MIEGIPIIDLGPPVIVSVTVLMLLTGRIIPRSTFVDKTQECDRWRQAYEAEREARAATDRQTVELLEVAKTTHDVIVAMFQGSERVWKGHEDNVSEKETKFK